MNRYVNIVYKLYKRALFASKFIYINRFKDFFFERNSSIGAFSKILFSSSDSTYRNQSVSLGNNAGIDRSCLLHVWDDNHILINDYTFLNDGCKILGDVAIERYCLLSANIFASSGNHYSMANPTWLIKDQDKYALENAELKNEQSKRIQIEEDCWIGYSVFIKSGIYIGRGAIIGANSVVTRNVPPYSIQAGMPNKELKRRLEFNPPLSISWDNDEYLPYFYRGFAQKREILEFSRRENIIYAHKESFVVLSEGNFNTFHFSGKKYKGVDSIQLIVSWQGRYEWALTIDADSFKYTLSKESSTPCATNQSKAIFNSIGNEMTLYNIITFQVINNSGVPHPIGITTITLER